MIHQIKQGKHRGKPVFGLYFDKKEISRCVTFFDSCRYDLKGPDQYDTNKLFGIGYLALGHHYNSARFGWRYDKHSDRIIISAYCYVKGKRIIDDIVPVKLNQEYKLTIRVHSTFYSFLVEKGKDVEETIILRHKSVFDIGYPLGLYFGGNQKAPHPIHISIDKE